MGFLDWIRGSSKTGESTESQEGIEIPPDRNLFMNDVSQPVESDLAESYRIEEIIGLINTNWAEIGYKDALVNHDRALMTKNIHKVTSEIKLKMTDALRLFSITVLATEHAMRLSQETGLMDTAKESSLRIEQTQKNVEYLQNLLAELERGEGAFTMVKNAYEHGFIKGINAMIHSKFLDIPLP